MTADKVKLLQKLFLKNSFYSSTSRMKRFKGWQYMKISRAVSFKVVYIKWSCISRLTSLSWIRDNFSELLICFGPMSGIYVVPAQTFWVTHVFTRKCGCWNKLLSKNLTVDGSLCQCCLFVHQWVLDVQNDFWGTHNETALNQNEFFVINLHR